jgi:hypothetical protein
MTARRWVAKYLGILGFIAIFLAFQPAFVGRSGVSGDARLMDHLRDNPGDMPLMEDYRFGWAKSPLVHYHREQSLQQMPEGDYTSQKSSGLSFGWVSWSALTLAIGLGLLGIAKRLKPDPLPG